MASKPAMVPEDALHHILFQAPDADWHVAKSFVRKQDCADWIAKQRNQGDYVRYYIYAPDSLHEVEVVNRVKWEKL